MRLSIVGPVYPYRGGIAHYTTRLVQTLQSAGHEVQVVSFSSQYPAWLYPGQTDRDPSQSRLEIPANYWLHPLQPWTWLSTAARIARFEPQLALLPWWSTFWAPSFGSLVRRLKQLKVKPAYLIHNVLPHEARFFDRWLTRYALSPVQDFLAQTERQQQRLLNLLPKAHIRTCPHPLYQMFTTSQRPSQAEARQQYHLPPETPVILFFGMVRPYKGLSVLLEAVTALHQRGEPVNLLVAGEFWQGEDAYRAQAEQLSIAAHVFIHNRYIPNEEMPALFAAADVFCAPYTGGTQSGAVKTALGFGLPVVLTETIADDLVRAAGDWAHIVPPGDVTALAEGLQQALTPPAAPLNLPADGGWGRLADEVIAMAG